MPNIRCSLNMLGLLKMNRGFGLVEGQHCMALFVNMSQASCLGTRRRRILSQAFARARRAPNSPLWNHVSQAATLSLLGILQLPLHTEPNQ